MRTQVAVISTILSALLTQFAPQLSAAATSTETFDPSRFASVSVRSEIYGPSLTDFGSMRPNLITGAPNNPKDRVRAENKIVAAYRLTPSLLAGAGFETNWLAANGWVLRDPYLMIQERELYRSGNFTLDGQIRGYIGVTDSSRQAHSPFAVRIAPRVVYRVPGSRWSADLTTFMHIWFFSGSGPRGATQERFHLNPNIYYQALPKLKAMLSYKTWSNHRVEQGDLALNGEPTSIGPGVIWDVAQGVSANPYLDFSPGNGFSPSTTTFGLNLNWQVI